VCAFQDFWIQNLSFELAINFKTENLFHPEPSSGTVIQKNSAAGLFPFA
jgi:hypothetical protein